MVESETETLPFEIVKAKFDERTYRRGNEELGREFQASIMVDDSLIELTGKLALHQARVNFRNEMAVCIDDSLDVRLEIGNSNAGKDILMSNEESTRMVAKILSSGTAVEV